MIGSTATQKCWLWLESTGRKWLATLATPIDFRYGMIQDLKLTELLNDRLNLNPSRLPHGLPGDI